MTLPRAKCIGGPFDGRWKEYYPGKPMMYYRESQALPPVISLEGPIPMNIALREYVYRCEQIHCGEEIFVLLVHQEIPMGDAMRLMITHYNPPI